MKGNQNDPDNNYRAITLLCFLGYLFTAIRNTRLNSYADIV